MQFRSDAVSQEVVGLINQNFAAIEDYVRKRMVEPVRKTTVTTIVMSSNGRRKPFKGKYYEQPVRRRIANSEGTMYSSGKLDPILP